MGKKCKIEITEEILEQVEKLAAQGLSQQQIFACLGWSEASFYKYKASDIEFKEALKRGQARGIADVTNALYKNAKSGNVVSQIFFLKNRDPDSWKDKVEQKVEQEITHSLSDPDVEELSKTSKGRKLLREFKDLLTGE